MPSSLAVTCDLSPCKGSGMESVLGPSPCCSCLVATWSSVAKPAGRGTGWGMAASRMVIPPASPGPQREGL